MNIFHFDDLRAKVASSMDIVNPSDPLSTEYNIVEGIETQAPSLRCQSETTMDATTFYWEMIPSQVEVSFP